MRAAVDYAKINPVDPLNDDLSWAAYVLDGRDNPDYFDSERYFASFPPGAHVLDVGCGTGYELQKLLDRGCTGAGVEVNDWSLEQAAAKGRPVHRAPAEALPFPDASFDGVIFKGVLSFTDEDRAFAEIARVLRPGGRLEALYQGPGFALRDLLLGRSARKRIYGARSLANSVGVALAGLRLPGWLGDTAHVTHGRLARHYRRYGLRLVTHTPSPTFLGLPVYIYHSAERTGGPAGPPRSA